jgi:hypothetical protein
MEGLATACHWHANVKLHIHISFEAAVAPAGCVTRANSTPTILWHVFDPLLSRRPNLWHVVTLPLAKAPGICYVCHASCTHKIHNICMLIIIIS